jgi:hypothetical protein
MRRCPFTPATSYPYRCASSFIRFVSCPKRESLTISRMDPCWNWMRCVVCCVCGTWWGYVLYIIKMYNIYMYMKKEKYLFHSLCHTLRDVSPLKQYKYGCVWFVCTWGKKGFFFDVVS